MPGTGGASPTGRSTVRSRAQERPAPAVVGGRRGGAAVLAGEAKRDGGAGERAAVEARDLAAGAAPPVPVGADRPAGADAERERESRGEDRRGAAGRAR